MEKEREPRVAAESLSEVLGGMINPDDDCPLCASDYSDEFVEMIQSAKPVGEPMTLDEFTAWLAQSREVESDIAKSP